MTRKSRREIEHAIGTVEDAVAPTIGDRLAELPPENLVLVMLDQRAKLIEDPDDEDAQRIRERAAAEYQERLRAAGEAGDL